MIKRQLQNKLNELSKKFPVLVVIGPRQSGKTTLVRAMFKDKEYASLEDPDTRLFAQNDPRAFLSNRKNGLIIDEAQKVPELFSYIQSFVDQNPKNQNIILTGSNNFLLHEKISQTLAGRVAINTLLPFSFSELNLKKSEQDYTGNIFKGFYPPIYDREISPTDWYPNYIRTYIERDVRLIKNITDLNSFILFVKLCAGRVGQLLNLSNLAVETGISVNTAKSWLSILEASFIVFRLETHHENYNKRLVKMPKLYFYDTGLVCSLLGLSSFEQVKTHYLLGSLFENLIISELVKYKFNNTLNFGLFFWRDKMGHEIDCLVDDGLKKILIEIKAGKTFNPDFTDGINYYKNIAGKKEIDSFIIYGGSKKETRSFGKILPWFDSDLVFE